MILISSLISSLSIVYTRFCLQQTPLARRLLGLLLRLTTRDGQPPHPSPSGACMPSWIQAVEGAEVPCSGYDANITF
ncbi:hypothetical protein C8Q74DRAFT_1255799 [Fomes fomentarius]|nr:hypothetical protein C8Q74DRAFT_1255799 [Fomes fomentarius]